MALRSPAGPIPSADRRLRGPVRLPAQAGRIAQVPPDPVIPSRASRARLTAAARSEKSAPTLSLPRTLARRPPCLRRMRWASLRSTLGRVAR